MELGVAEKWEDDSSHPDTAAKVVDLVWTDVAANAVTGTKGLMDKPHGNQTDALAIKHPVRQYVRRVRYHLPFMVLACIVLAFALAILRVVIFLWGSGRFQMAKMRRFLARIGRVLTLFLFSDECDPWARTNDWIRLVGTKVIDSRAIGGTQKKALGRFILPQQPRTFHCWTLILNGRGA